MHKRSSKARDLNSLAAAIVGHATGPEDKGDDAYEARIPPLSSWGGSGASPGCLTERGERRSVSPGRA